MSAYGAQVFLKGTAFDVINAFAPSYVMDIITVASGSKTYDIPPGTAIQAQPYTLTFFEGGNLPSITISGRTVSWSGNAGNNGYIIIVWSS
ncbi:hypothetical protein PMPD1_2456 [Paramixta manurensis]|uniref:Uncharacterized protein n=1 Tax=Paramixta manurensis TaxID=2740817 RepID=A0A6M8U9J4_9GAMM|nr:hypothetical protein PMPD1_2456 [Erwiniaceae bacterium PD-1]